MIFACGICMWYLHVVFALREMLAGLCIAEDLRKA